MRCRRGRLADGDGFGADGDGWTDADAVLGDGTGVTEADADAGAFDGDGDGWAPHAAMAQLTPPRAAARRKSRREMSGARSAMAENGIEDRARTPRDGDDVAVRTLTNVAIVGGGAIGSAIACFLLEDPLFHGRVTVYERDPTYRRASSALSASSIRQQFSTPENIRMSRFGFEFLRGMADRVGLVESGYLYLASPGYETVMREIHEVQRAEGANVVLLDPAALGARFPWMALDGVGLGSLGLEGEGWFDGYALLRVLRDRAVTHGATYVAGEVVGATVDGSRVTSIALADGTVADCDTLVDAAGPWARDVAAMVDVPLPVEARRRSVFVFDASRPPTDCPLVIDTSSAWFRPEGEQFIAAIPPAEDEDLDGLPLEVDRDQWEDVLWPALAARVPAFDAVRMTTAWAGYYETNTFDHNAIIGRHPRLTNFLLANGFSGHGIQQAPAVGRAIAELIVHDRFVTLDLSIFGYERIEAGRPVVERNVIG